MSGAWRRCKDFVGQQKGTLLRLFLAGQGVGLARQGRAGGRVSRQGSEAGGRVARQGREGAKVGRLGKAVQGRTGRPPPSAAKAYSRPVRQEM